MEEDNRLFRNIIGYRTLKNSYKTHNCLCNLKRKILQDYYTRLIEQINNDQIFVIDRIEEKIAVCENRNTKEIINIDLSNLPIDVKEGDVIRFRDNKFEIDEKEKETIQERINNKVKDLFID